MFFDSLSRHTSLWSYIKWLSTALTSDKLNFFKNDNIYSGRCDASGKLNFFKITIYIQVVVMAQVS